MFGWYQNWRRRRACEAVYPLLPVLLAPYKGRRMDITYGDGQTGHYILGGSFFSGHDDPRLEFLHPESGEGFAVIRPEREGRPVYSFDNIGGRLTIEFESGAIIEIHPPLK
jgi:hypothetical protein